MTVGLETVTGSVLTMGKGAGGTLLRLAAGTTVLREGIVTLATFGIGCGVTILGAIAAVLTLLLPVDGVLMVSTPCAVSWLNSS